MKFPVGLKQRPVTVTGWFGMGEVRDPSCRCLHHHQETASVVHQAFGLAEQREVVKHGWLSFESS